jgi:putative DNA primase/helicase
MSRDENVRAALSYVPPSDRDTWVRVGMAIKDEFGDDGFELWDSWSQADESYRSSDARSVWRSIHPGGGITVATLYHEAKQRGWSDGHINGNVRLNGHALRDPSGLDRDPAHQHLDATELQRRRSAQDKSQSIWDAALPAPASHGYLQRKGIGAHVLRLYSGDLEIAGMRCHDALIVPIRDVTGALQTLEFIAENGDKRYLPGGRKAGGYLALGKPADVLLIAEGVATGASLHQATGHATAIAFDAGNMRAVAEALRDKFPAAKIVIAGDNDANGVGQRAAQEAAIAVKGYVTLPEQEGTDWNDVFVSQGVEVIRSAIEVARAPQVNATVETGWVEPTPLSEGLPPVDAFDYELLPPALRRRVEDIADRMQCPPDFPAVAIMTMLSSLIGRRCGIAPKREDDWTVVPNLWGMVIGRPGIMKSPPLTEVMRPLQVLQARASDVYNSEQADFQAGAMVAAEAERVAKDTIRKLLKNKQTGDAHDLAQQTLDQSGEEPICRRYVVNDSTVEKLGEILNQNPFGILLFRDELNGFFRTLERQGHEADRAFYLECWNGDNSFTYDRIGRGTLHINGACLAALGGIQPGPLADIVRGLRGSGDDGLLQRFQLAVWPDVSPGWKNVDRAPDHAARTEVLEIIERLDRLTPESFGAEPGTIPQTRFNPEAQELFDVWRERLEHRLRSDAEHPMLEAHLAKYRSLVPSLALIIHMTEAHCGPVELLPLERAISWAEYLESHARRIYAPAISPDMDAARLLARRIRRGELGDSFNLRSIYNNGWSGLSTRDEVAAAVAVLTDHDWLRTVEEPTAGRTRTIYQINPAIRRDTP